MDQVPVLRACATLLTMSRILRRACAFLAIATLVFSQLAVSAYACPMSMPESANYASDSGGDDCEMSGNSNLCDRHCDYGASSVQSSPIVFLAPQLAPLPWRVPPMVALSFSTPVGEWLQPTRIEPPPLVRFGVLRI
jgi:hypothetical protein